VIDLAGRYAVRPGKRYFGPVDAQHLPQDPDTVIQGDRVPHLRYRVRKAA